MQLISLGILAIQAKRYFEELFHLGTTILKQRPRSCSFRPGTTFDHTPRTVVVPMYNAAAYVLEQIDAFARAVGVRPGVRGRLGRQRVH